MPNRRGTAVLFACFVLGLLPLRALAFQAQSAVPAVPPDPSAPRLIPRTAGERQQRYVALHRIILNVHIADSSGKPYPDLTQADFAVYDNNQARDLVSFRSVEGSAAQAHILLVLDTVNSFTKQVRYFAKEIEKYLTAPDGPLPVPVSIGIFTGAHIDFGPASRDRGALLADLKSRTANLHATGCVTGPEHEEKVDLNGVAKGASMQAKSAATLACLNERFVSSINALHFLASDQFNVPGRAIVIWIGPGWPLLTNKGFEADTPQIKQNFFDQLVALSMQLREGQVTVEAIASPDQPSDPNTISARDFDFFEGVVNPDQARAGNLGLHALAHQTGGMILTEQRDVAGQLQQCVADAQSYYVLAFDSPAAASFGEYHTLGVKVDKPGLDVRTNTMYYGEQ